MMEFKCNKCGKISKNKYEIIFCDCKEDDALHESKDDNNVKNEVKG